MQGSFPRDTESPLPQIRGTTPAMIRLDNSPIPDLNVHARAALMHVLKRTGSKAYAIFAISEKCTEDGDYTERHNECMGTLALELYEELQALGIRITE